MGRNDGRAQGNSNEHSQAENELISGVVSEQTKAFDRLKMTQFCLDRAADAIFWMEADARFIYVNETACRSLGYSCVVKVPLLSNPYTAPKTAERSP